MGEPDIERRLTDALRARIGHDGADPADPNDLDARLAAQQAILVADRPVEVGIKADPLAEEVEVGGWLCTDLLDVATALDLDETKAARLVVTAGVPTASMAIIAESLEWLADETKRDFSTERRADYAKAGIALPDGSYPIPDKDALHRAIQSYGRGNTDKAVVKRHIIKRARALDAVSMLPDDWHVKGWGPWEHPADPEGDEEKLFGRAGGGPKWDPSLHPRDAEGQFIRSGSTVSIPGGGKGEVIGSRVTPVGGVRVGVRLEGGTEREFKPTDLRTGEGGFASFRKPEKEEAPSTPRDKSGKRMAVGAAVTLPDGRTGTVHNLGRGGKFRGGKVSVVMDGDNSEVDVEPGKLEVTRGAAAATARALVGQDPRIDILGRPRRKDLDGAEFEDPEGDEEKARWEAGKHPRDAHGKFAETGGLGKAPSALAAAVEAGGDPGAIGAGLRALEARDRERSEGRESARRAGFSMDFGRLDGEHGTVRTTNGGEVSGKLTSPGSTYNVEVERDDGLFTRIPSDRVAGVRLGESSRTPHLDPSTMSDADIEATRARLTETLNQYAPGVPARRLYEEMLADLGPPRLTGAALETAIREQRRRRSGVGRPFGRTAAADLAPSKSAPWLQVIEDAEAAFEADFGDPAGDEEKLFRRARGKAPKWDPGEHPRDSRGRFASVGATVKLPGGGQGRVVGTAPGGKVKVRRSDGAELTVDAKQTTVTRGPQASAAADAAEKVRQKVTGDKPDEDRAEVRRQGQEEGARQAAKPKPEGPKGPGRRAQDRADAAMSKPLPDDLTELTGMENDLYDSIQGRKNQLFEAGKTKPRDAAKDEKIKQWQARLKEVQAAAAPKRAAARREMDARERDEEADFMERDARAAAEQRHAKKPPRDAQEEAARAGGVTVAETRGPGRTEAEARAQGQARAVSDKQDQIAALERADKPDQAKIAKAKEQLAGLKAGKQIDKDGNVVEPKKPERRAEEEHDAESRRLDREATAAEKAGDTEKGKRLRNEALKERAVMKAGIAERKPARGRASEHQANYERLAGEAEAAEKAGDKEKGNKLRQQALAERARANAAKAENRQPRKIPAPSKPGQGRTAQERVTAGGEAAAEDVMAQGMTEDMDQMADDLHDLDAGIVQRSNALRQAGENPKNDAKIKAWSKRSDQLEARLKRRGEQPPGKLSGAGGIGHTREDAVANRARGQREWDRMNALGQADTPQGQRAYSMLAREHARLNMMDAELAKPGKLDEKLVNYKPERDLADLSKTEPLAKMLPNAREVAYSKTPFIAELHKRMGITDAESHDMGDYLEKRDELFNKQPLQEVPFDDVVVTQPRVRGERVQQIRDHPETGGSKPQHFVRFNGETYVMNGHHRVAAQILDGQKGAVGRVLDLDQRPNDDTIDRSAWTGGVAPNGATGEGTRPDGEKWGTGYPDGDPRQDPAYDQYTTDLDAKLDEKLVKLGNTQERYDMVEGVPKAYTAERQALHERILDDQMEKYKNVPRDYKAVVMAGPPGAGKSTVIKTNGADFGVEADDRGDPTNFATVNPDELKGELLNYGAVPDDYFDTGISPAEGAAFTHEESSDLAEQLAQRLRAGGYNVIMDGTFAGNSNKQVGKVHALRDAGYEVTGVLVDGTVEKSLVNAGFRHSKQKGSPPATPGGPYRGRYVSIDLIEGNKPKGDVGDSKVFGRPHRNASSENIERVQDAFDGGVIWYDNQTGQSKKVKSTVPAAETRAIRRMDVLDRRIEAVSDEKVKAQLRRELAALKQSFDFEFDSLALAWMRRGWGELETKVADALGDSFAELLAEEFKAEGGADRNRGNAERLRRYWTHGEGATAIRWGEAGDHMRCVRQLVQHGKFRTDQAHGYCNLREKEATGRYPAQHAAASKVIDWLDGLVEVKADQGIENVNPTPEGVMVALYPPDDVAAALSLKTGVPAEELHVTLAYLGKVADVGDRLDELVSAVAAFGDDSYDLAGEVSGLGRFSNTEDPAGDALVALVDAPDLVDFRVDIVDALEDAGFEVSADHGFTPHMTLAYIGAEEKLPLSRLEPVPVTFGALSVAVGGDVWDFPLHPTDGSEDRHRAPGTEGEGDAPYDKGKSAP